MGFNEILSQGIVMLGLMMLRIVYIKKEDCWINQERNLYFMFLYYEILNDFLR